MFSTMNGITTSHHPTTTSLRSHCRKERQEDSKSQRSERTRAKQNLSGCDGSIRFYSYYYKMNGACSIPNFCWSITNMNTFENGALIQFDWWDIIMKPTTCAHTEFIKDNRRWSTLNQSSRHLNSYSSLQTVRKYI